MSEDETRELYVVPGLTGPKYDRLAVSDARPVHSRRIPTPEEIEAEERELYAEYVDVAGAVLSFEDWQAMRAESAYERSMSDYYGSGAPATLTERVREDWRESRDAHK